MLLGVGGAVVLAGIVKGVDESVACGAECPTRPLTGILLLGGLAVSTGGFLWLQISYRTQRRLDSRVHQLQWQLQGLQHARRLSAPPPTVTLLQARF